MALLQAMDAVVFGVLGWVYGLPGRLAQLVC